MDRVYYLVADTPANTPIATPVSTPFPLEDNILQSLTIDIPDGHCGLTGIRILRAQQQIFPWANNSYFIANDYHKDYPFADQMTGTGIVVVTYNTDIFDHKFYVTAIISDLPLPTEVAPSELGAAQAPFTGPVGFTDYLSTDFLVQPSPTTGEKTKAITKAGQQKQKLREPHRIVPEPPKRKILPIHERPEPKRRR